MVSRLDWRSSDAVPTGFELRVHAQCGGRHCAPRTRGRPRACGLSGTHSAPSLARVATRELASRKWVTCERSDANAGFATCTSQRRQLSWLAAEAAVAGCAPCLEAAAKFSNGGKALCMAAGSGRFTTDVLEPPAMTSRQFTELY